MATRHPHTGRPRTALSRRWSGARCSRWRRCPGSLPMLAAPRGDGHPVLLLPGFMADEELADRAEALPAQPRLRRADLGLRAQRRLPAASMPGAGAEDPLPAPQHAAARSAWSAGAWAACSRSTARTRRRECVRSVITLGSPVSVDADGSQSPPLREGAVPADRAPAWGRPRTSMQPRAKKLRERQPPGDADELPLFAQRRRGAAAGSHHRRRPGAAREHPRRRAATPGWASTPMVLCIVADRLAQPEGAVAAVQAGPGVSAGAPACLRTVLASSGTPPARAAAGRCGRCARGARRSRAATAPGTPGSCRARTARRPRGRASARGTRSAR